MCNDPVNETQLWKHKERRRRKEKKKEAKKRFSFLRIPVSSSVTPACLQGNR